MSLDGKIAYIRAQFDPRSGWEHSDEEIGELLERDDQNRQQLTSFQLAELGDDEVVENVHFGWAFTTEGVHIAQDGERIIGSRIDRRPGDEADMTALLIDRC